MGWVDEAYRDREGLFSPNTDQMWTTGELTYDQFGTIIQNKGYPKLADYLQEAQPGKKFIVVGEKAMPSTPRLRSRPLRHIGRRHRRAVQWPVVELRRSPVAPDAACNATLGGRYRFPSGVNVPTYLDPFCGRLLRQLRRARTAQAPHSPSWIYPLDGNRFVPGQRPAPTSAATTGWPTRPWT